MSLTFVQQIDAVSRRIRRRRWAAAACWSFVALAAAMLALIGSDWLLGVYHLAGRVILTTLLLIALVAIWRWGRGAARGRTSPLDVALELERLHPEHRSLLASGLEFSQQERDDPTAGSMDLRRAVVLRASLAAEAIDLEAAAPRAPLRRAAVAALAAAITLGIPAAVAPQGFAIGVVRLLNPLSDAEWPRRHDLEFVDPPQLLPVGDDFQTALRDRRGALPSSVEVEYRTRRQGRWHYQSQTYSAAGDSVDVRWPNVQESFEFRARGGDHESMPWRRVETAPAPQIESLEVTVHPPAYTRLPAEQADDPVRVIAGSRLQLRGRTSSAIQTATLQSKGQASISLAVGSNERSFDVAEIEWQPTRSAEWSFSLTTPRGMTAVADRRLRIEVTPDRPPTVGIRSPTEDLMVLPEARIEFTVEASDDLAVRAIGLTVSPEERAAGAAAAIELFRGSGNPAAGRRAIAHVLELSSLAPAPETAWQVAAYAEDYAGQKSMSRPARLRVISREEFVRRIDALVARLAATLARGRDEQHEARRRVDDWQTSTTRPTVDQVLATLSRQRQVVETLAAGSESAIHLCRSLQTEYRRNQWPDDDARAQIDRIAEELLTLSRTQLAAIETNLTAFARHARPPTESDSTLSAADLQMLSATRAQQDEALAALEAMIRELSQSSELQQHQRELAELKREQAAVLEQTEALALEALRRDAQQNKADVDRRREQLIGKQRALAVGLARALGRMRQTASALAGVKPSDAARLDAVVAAAEKGRTQGEIQAAADHLAAERFAQAAASQQKTEAQLGQLLDQLAKPGEDSAAQRLADLEQAERRLETLRREAKALAAEQKKAESLRAEAKQRELERLELARQELADQTKQLARRLEQLRAASAAQPAQRAAEQLEKRDGSQQSSEQVQRDLDEAQRQLAAERRRQQTLLSKQQIERLDAVLGRLVAAQQAVVEETLRLDGLRAADGTLGPTQRASLAQLAKRQIAVREQSTTQADQIEQFPVFARLLRAAADTMEEAEGRLAIGDTGADAVQLVTRAQEELKRLADAVRQQRQQQSQPPKPNEPQPPKPGGNADGQKNDPDQAQALQLAVAQLGLLRTMQADLQERTSELERTHSAIDDKTLREQSAKLAAEQRELAELAGTLVREVALPPAEESLLPDLDEELRKSLGEDPDAEDLE